VNTTQRGDEGVTKPSHKTKNWYLKIFLCSSKKKRRTSSLHGGREGVYMLAATTAREERR